MDATSTGATSTAATGTSAMDAGTTDRTRLEALAEFFAAGPATILTGAGISTDSGIPDYRGAGSPPRTPMNITQFMEDPQYRRRFWAGARVGAFHTAGIEPNAGHRAVAALEAAGRLNGVSTQNVDGLHARAGSRTVVELHGSGGTIRCTGSDHHWTRAEVLAWFDVANPGFAERNAGAEITPDGDADVSETAGVIVPVCPACGGMLRPDVVYFGEHVPKQTFARAAALVETAQAFVVAGSSLAVNTGIRLVHRAERRGIPVAVINRGPTAIDARPSVRVRIDAGTSEVLAALAERLGVGTAA